ncbi:MAG: hypothetical protein ACXV6K_08535 [Halobacteriota archaeon]
MIVKTLVDPLFYIASYTIEAAILINLERIEPSLKLWHNDLIAPLAGRVISSVMGSTPALKAHAVNLPPRYVHNTPGEEERPNVVTCNLRWQHHGTSP